MHILIASAEIAPFSHVDGAADFCAALSANLRTYQPAVFAEPDENGQRLDAWALPNPVETVSVITPLHGGLDKDALRLARRLTSLQVETGNGKEEVVVYEGQTPDRVRVFFLEHEALAAKRLYGRGDAARYAFFDRAIVEFCRSFPISIDVVHCCGWPTALVPVYLDAYGDKNTEDILTLFTPINLDHQGSFASRQFKDLNLPKAYLADDAVKAGSKINYTKGGVLFADFVTVHSPAQVAELTQKGLGYGLEEDFEEREEDIFGVLPGVDMDRWNPASDPNLPVAYDVEKLNGKRRNKSDLQYIFGLPPRPMIPLVGYLSPLTEDSGAALAIEAATAVLETGTSAQFIFLTEGDDEYKGHLVALKEKYPKSVGLHFGRDEALEHRFLAGVDIAMFPEKRASGAMSQILAMRYGAVPVARDTGTLQDTIADWDGTGDQPDGFGAGILFDEFETSELQDALERAFSLMKKPRQWRPMLQQCMGADFSWSRAAHHYAELYQELLDFEFED